MATEKKTFARTVRMKESIRLYVEAQEGHTFSDKLENMVRHCMESLPALEKEIALKKEYFERVKKETTKLSDIKDKLDRIGYSVDSALGWSKDIKL